MDRDAAVKATIETAILDKIAGLRPSQVEVQRIATQHILLSHPNKLKATEAALSHDHDVSTELGSLRVIVSALEDYAASKKANLSLILGSSVVPKLERLCKLDSLAKVGHSFDCFNFILWIHIVVEGCGGNHNLLSRLPVYLVLHVNLMITWRSGHG
jgi:hypothetical protein